MTTTPVVRQQQTTSGECLTRTFWVRVVCRKNLFGDILDHCRLDVLVSCPTIGLSFSGSPETGVGGFEAGWFGGQKRGG